MQMIDGRIARKTMRDAGMPDGLADAIACGFLVPKNVVNYSVALWQHGMRGEQIVIIFHNSTATANILNVRRFFRELGPIAVHFGFAQEQIENDIGQFNDEMEKYAHEIMGARELEYMYQHPGMIKEKVAELVGMCAAGKNKFYRAGIEFIAWRRTIHESNEKISAVLGRCITDNGINIKRLLRLTTGHSGYGINNIVSRTDGTKIKPKIRMRNIKYVTDVYRFFGENAGVIRNIARKYSDVDFMSALYDVCIDWPGWSWNVSPEKIQIPDYKVKHRDGVEFVVLALAAVLPPDVRQMMLNIALHEFEKNVSTAKYEYAWEQFVRRDSSKR